MKQKNKNQCKCPHCGAPVETKVMNGVKYGYYQERPKTKIEQGIEKRLGMPFRHMETHTCEGISKIERV